MGNLSCDMILLHLCPRSFVQYTPLFPVFLVKMPSLIQIIHAHTVDSRKRKRTFHENGLLRQCKPTNKQIPLKSNSISFIKFNNQCKHRKISVVNIHICKYTICSLTSSPKHRHCCCLRQHCIEDIYMG